MDSEARNRILERLQEDFDIDEYTTEELQTKLNEVMGNASAHTRTDRWKEDKRSRERKVYVRFSNTKDRIAKEMASSFQPFSLINNKGSLKEINFIYKDNAEKYTKKTKDKFKKIFVPYLKEKIKTTESGSEFTEAVESLRKTNYRVLGGIRSGQTRRAKLGFRVLFN